MKSARPKTFSLKELSGKGHRRQLSDGERRPVTSFSQQSKQSHQSPHSQSMVQPKNTPLKRKEVKGPKMLSSVKEEGLEASPVGFGSLVWRRVSSPDAVFSS
jgi:hypothetical protein